MTSQHRKGHRHRRKHKPESRGGPRREHIEELSPSEDVPSIESFGEWDLGEELQRGIAAMDITRPTPIQALSIGPVLEGRDVIAKAETGTGKTLAFGAPMIARIDPARATVLGLVLCPTRELAQQVCDVLQALALPRGVRVALVVGGDPMHPQIAALQAGAQVVVGTPGRVLDLAGQRFLSFPWTEYVVLDEADKMFEIGFLDDIKKILAITPDERQTLLFSATFPTEVLKLARNSTRDPLEVATAKGTATVSSIDQRYLQVDEGEQPMALIRLLEQSGKDDVFLVFCERRTEVDRLMRRLERLPFQVKALHGGYDQASRFRVMTAFRTGDVKALVATDVASRGLDVQHVTHVINLSVPRESESYTHRIGRTGRAGRTGTAITMLIPADQRRWSDLLRRTKFDIKPLDAPGRTRAPRDQDRDRGRSRDRDSSRDRDRDSRDRGRTRGPDRDQDREPVGKREDRSRQRETTEEQPVRRGRRVESREREERKPEPERRPRRRSRDEEVPRSERSRGRSEEQVEGPGRRSFKAEELRDREPEKREQRRRRETQKEERSSTTSRRRPDKDSESSRPRRQRSRRDEGTAKPERPDQVRERPRADRKSSSPSGPSGFGEGI